MRTEAKTRYATLTDAVVRGLPLIVHGERPEVVRDQKLPGFYVLIGEETKTYYVQFDVKDETAPRKRKTIKRALGRADRIPVADARKKALELIAHKDEQDTGPSIDNVTFGQAWEEYKAYLLDAGRSALTIRGGDDTVNRVLKNWQDTPLRWLAEHPGEVEDRYREIKTTVGIASAKNVMACLRAVYNRAIKRHPLLRALPNPVFFRLQAPAPRTDTALSAAELPDWFRQVRSLPNSIRQAAHLMCLLTGSRWGALFAAKWSDIGDGVLRLPHTKNGDPLDIPLSRRMKVVLRWLRMAGRKMYDGSPFIFPAGRGAEHMAGAQEKQHPDLAVGHALRHTYSTLARAAGVDGEIVELLLGHRLPGMRGVYVSRDALLPKLAAAQETVSEYLWKAMTSEA